MKKGLFVAAFMLAVSQAALADQTISVGYAHGKISGGDKLNGINVKYQAGLNDKLGIIGSATYMQGDDDINYMIDRDRFEGKTESKYYAFSAGPSYQFHDKIRGYATVGLAYTKVEGNVDWLNYERGTHVKRGSSSGSESRTALNYGVGVQFYPVRQLVIDLAYEGAQATNGAENKGMNGVHVGVGYRF